MKLFTSRLVHNFLFLKKRWFFSACFLLAWGALAADTDEPGTDVSDHDIQALREWIYTKRQVTVAEKGGALSISGEVRTEFQKTVESKNGVAQRSERSGVFTSDGLDRTSTSGFDIEVNLMLDYRTDRTWAAVKLEFDNAAGVFGGTLNKIKLERAFLGTRVIEADTYTLDFLFGRSRMSSLFDSKVEFGSFFDGILSRYDLGLESIGDLYAHVGAFVVDERHNHYAYVGEFGMLNIASTGLYTKLSLIDWDTKHYSNRRTIEKNGVQLTVDRVDNERFDFVVGQWILGYKFYPSVLKKTTLVYLAGLYNFAAKRLPITNERKANTGGYLGFTIGELRKQGDWSFDANYQVLAAQRVPDFDTNGIGLGNAAGSGFYTANPNGSGGLNTRETAGGDVNYRGFALSLEYLITGNLNLFQMWQQAITLEDAIGPFCRFKQYEVELIYSF